MKEDKILLEIDEKFDSAFIKENFIHEIEKMPNKIKSSLERGKILEKEWKENNINSLINDCLNIENSIKEIEEIYKDIKKCHSNEKIKINIDVNENEINNLVEKIKNFGEIIEEKENLNLYSDFKIGLKEPTYNLKYHTNSILTLTQKKY